MAKRLDEYVQLANMAHIQEEIRNLNYGLVNAINETNIMRELVKEKGSIILKARKLSKDLLPDIEKLNDHFFSGAEHVTPKKTARAKPKPVRKAAKRVAKKTRASRVKLDSTGESLDELKKNLASLRRQLRN